MRAINMAYEVLADPHKRAAYNTARWGAGAPRPSVSRSSRPVATSVASSAPPGGTTRLVGIVFLVLIVGFGTLTCVLSSRVPTTTRPDGVPILPRATATALALAALSPAQRAALEPNPCLATQACLARYATTRSCALFHYPALCRTRNTDAIRRICAGLAARFGDDLR